MAAIDTVLSCPSCRRAQLQVMAPVFDPRVLLRCPSCRRSWWSPSLHDPVRDSELRQGVEAASLGDVRNAGWTALLAAPR